MGFIQLKLPKRIKHRLARSKKRKEALERHNRWLKKQGLDDIKVPKNFGYEPEKWEPDLNYPKTSDKIGATATKKEEMVYSGERRLVGIATMHKSNQVPVFADDDDVSGRKKATEITLMKGNK
tara:strand:+ start:183 stop:551 length:369 start_codon:yes stop_codon:yes gene_type:complete